MFRQATEGEVRSDALGLAGIALLCAISGTASAQPSDTPEDDTPIVVTGQRPPILVTAPPRCRRRSGDPLDAVVIPSGTAQSVIRMGKDGKLEFRRDDEPVLGPNVWQRAGSAIGEYVFRVPEDAKLLCIGALAEYPRGWGQLRQIVAGGPYEGRYVQLTAWVATRAAREVRFWLAAGTGATLHDGGDTSGQPLQGTNGWTPVSLVIGPIPSGADHISYGFLLYGSGDVWVTGLKIEAVNGRGLPRREGGITRIGGRSDLRAPDNGDKRDLDRKVLENPPK
jgi:hypothetical protein